MQSLTPSPLLAGTPVLIVIYYLSKTPSASICVERCLNFAHYEQYPRSTCIIRVSTCILQKV